MSTLLDDLTSVVAPALGEVRVVENGVPLELRREILRLVRRPIWAYGWKSVKDHDCFGFWHAHFAGGDEETRESCEEALAANLQASAIHALWVHLSSTVLRGHVPLRVYANGHTYGVEGSIHTDSMESDAFTTIYYAHGAWDPDWAGETVFFPSDSATAQAVLPVPGRLIVFRGATPHVARSVSRQCPELRVSVVIKSRVVAVDEH
ncbi:MULTISPECIES: 2OG-Fe(II) oxygenase [Stenotrophomonas]|uniref:2OG-Fe(II) oxygenase n=1 Tax=Stenotrophomonas TaxID=40323 RepID=UPI000A300392|nr:2OG-Fe(II) oxygenase [Stenotrophomonas maltophilia]ARQ91563.1 hypothetical protein A7326_18905 [Stenotrophomonas maltophilia]